MSFISCHSSDYYVSVAMKQALEHGMDTKCACGVLLNAVCLVSFKLHAEANGNTISGYCSRLNSRRMHACAIIH